MKKSGYVACAFAAGFWSLGFFFGKIAFTQFSVMHFLLYRFLFACLIMLPVARRPRFSRREWTLLATSALLGIPLQFGLQFSGLKLTTVSHAALMVGTMPVILAIGATVFAHERLHTKGWLALIGSTLGVVLIVFSRGAGAVNGGSLPGDLLVVLSLVIALGWVLLNQRLMARGQSPLSVTAWGLLLGTTILAVWVFVTSGPPPLHGIHTHVWLATIASGVLCTAASTLLWNWGIHRVPASRAGVFLNIEPAFGSLLGIVLLGEQLGPAAWIGGALIIGAAVIMTASH